jgi:hypothetical protein
MREMLQDKDSSEMYGVYLHKRDPRRSYVNFLRPETVTYMFDFIFSQLMEVELKEQPVEVNSGTNDSAAMISRNESSDNNLGLKFNDKSLENSVSALAKVRLRDNRKNINVAGNFATPNKQNDEQFEQQDFDDQDDGGDDENEIEDDGGMGLMLHKLTPITDSRKKKMKGLFRDDISADRPDVDLKEHQNKHAYKAPPNMASFDIPNNTFTKNTPEKDHQINNPRKANVFANCEQDDSMSARANGLFERKEL